MRCRTGLNRQVAPEDEGLAAGRDGAPRCWWATTEPLLESYHDDEWGRPVGDDTRLFEKLCLEGFQSGLSWLTILRKRENFRRAFDGFDVEAIARYRTEDVERLMADAGIIRNRAKIEATINNAARCLDLVAETGSLAAYIWSFEGAEAKALSGDLKRRDWRFVGPTTAYAFMQAMGLVDDHLEGCAVRDRVEAERARFERPSNSSTGFP
jgi:DNA-3-methyladenine glycosylase I